MYQFFVDDAQIGREFVTITGEDVNHIKKYASVTSRDGIIIVRFQK